MRRFLFTAGCIFSLASLATKSNQSCDWKAFLAAANARGIRFEDTIGFHGTSIEAIQEAVKTGKLPISLAAQPQAIFIFPNLKHPAVKKLIEQGKLQVIPGTVPRNSDEVGVSFLATQKYAKDVARRHRFLKELGLEMNKDNADWAADALSTDSGYSAARDKGFSSQKARAADNAAKRAKGVVLGISSDILTEHPLHNPPAPDEGVFFNVEEGLPIRYVIGVEPVGDEEFKYFERLSP